MSTIKPYFFYIFVDVITEIQYYAIKEVSMSDLGNKEIMARNIKKYMNHMNVKRSEISESVGVPYTTFNDWYNGITYPRIDKIEKMANYFGISKADLVEGDVSPEEILSPGEKDLLKLYRNANTDIRNAAIAVLKAGGMSDVEK